MKPNEIIQYLEMVRPTENYSHTFSVSVGNTRHFGPGSQLNKDVSTAIDLAIKSLEKQIPKKPVQNHHCPNCDYGIVTPPFANKDYLHFATYPNHCPECGQKINWEESP